MCPPLLTCHFPLQSNWASTDKAIRQPRELLWLQLPSQSSLPPPPPTLLHILLPPPSIITIYIRLRQAFKPGSICQPITFIVRLLFLTLTKNDTINNRSCSYLRLDRFCDRANLIHFQQETVTGFFLHSHFDALVKGEKTC